MTKAGRQQRGEPVAWVMPEHIDRLRRWKGVVNAKNITLYYAPGERKGLIPLFAAPQPADIGVDYKQLYEQMCERCDMLDAKLAEYSEQPAAPAQEPSDNEMAVIWDQIHASFGREPFRVTHVDYSRALLARYGSKS